MKPIEREKHQADAQSEAMEECAADWLARRDAGFSAAEQEAFERWLASDPRHFAMVAELESAWQVINAPRENGVAADVLTALAQRERQRGRKQVSLLAVSVGAAAAVLLALLYWPSGAKSRPDVVASSTIVVRPERQVLPDGSIVELNAGAAIAVEFTPERRGVRLLRGDALFSVAHDTAHRFVVTAGNVEVTAVGTAFLVSRAATEVGVVVTQGRVAVEADVGASVSPSTPVPLLLDAGRRVTVPLATAATAARAETITAAEIDRTLAWRGNRVEFSGTPLAEAVALLNRRNAVQLDLEASLGTLRVSGIFWIDNPEGFARLLEGSFGVRADPPANGRIGLHPAR